ncbi:MAG: arylsulfotransferase family protein [Ruegeria sp.]
MKSFDLPKAIFIATCALIVFAVGMAARHFQVFPYSAIVSAKNVYDQRHALFGNEPIEFIEPARYEGAGVTINNPEKSVPGLTFLTGFFDGQNEMRLVTAEGDVINHWPVTFFDVYPTPDHIQPADRVPQSEWNLAVQGAYLLPDGSVVFNFNFKGAAKIDRCGNLQWSIPLMAHHSFEPASDGSFWFAYYKWVESGSAHKEIKTPYREDVITKVSADGEILQEIPIIDLLANNDLLGLLYARSIWKNESSSLAHINDVEELDAETAAHFPQFEAGDIMISARLQDLILVFDPDTLKVKWFKRGPWLAQHDPDFMKTGKISVFSNNYDGTRSGYKLGGSTLIEFDPLNHVAEVVYGGTPDQPFYTDRAGEHQRIGENDQNALITESRAGRVFEITPDGEIVWEYINRYDDDSVLILNGARRYPESFFTVTDWSCS